MILGDEAVCKKTFHIIIIVSHDAVRTLASSNHLLEFSREMRLCQMANGGRETTNCRFVRAQVVAFQIWD